MSARVVLLRDLPESARRSLAPALVNGRVLAEGTPEEMARDPAVREAYLGEDAHV